MDDIAVRPRYSRHSALVRRKRRNVRDTDALVEKIVRQVIICLLILVVIGIVKSVNTPVTNFLTDKVKGILFQNIDMESIYQRFESFMNQGIKNDDEQSANSEDEVLPVSANASGVGDEDITYDGYTAGGESQGTALDIEEITAFINDKYSFVEPVDGVISSQFGERMNPVRQAMEMHTGIDIETEGGSQVKSALDGEVIYVGMSPEYGKCLKIKHGDGIETLYAHCSTVLVKKGEKVNQGDIIGEVGAVGLSVGSHLHFEVLKDGKQLNPVSFIKALPSE